MLVVAHNTTQFCSGCGEMVKKSLAVRIHKCSICGLILDRDYNAPIKNHSKVGQGRAGHARILDFLYAMLNCLF
ncbi:MAG: zinc ribbon domain-containing protein [Methanosarcinaceae archaeon]